MPPRTEQEEAGENRVLPVGIVLKPPVSAEDLHSDTEYDPQGAEEFVALIRGLRREAFQSIIL